MRSFIFLILLITIPAPALAEPPAEPDRFFWARVVKVSDGDTMTAVRRNDNLDMVTVRLYGLDAPESGQAFGKRSANELRKMIYKKIVQVEIMQKRDRYGRIVGIVRHDGKDVGREMAEAGLTWVYPRYCQRKSLCNGYWAAARRAQKTKTGMWVEWATAPWDWREAGSKKP